MGIKTQGYKQLKKDKAVAGLEIFLSVIVMLFVIGFLVMIFSLMSGELGTATYTTTSGTVLNETITTLNDTIGDSFTVATFRDVACVVTNVNNATSGSVVTASNYTVTNCLIQGIGSTYMNDNVNVSYTYTYEANNSATDAITDTSASLTGAIDWFPIIIVITAMVVLILLTVLIIASIRGSGMIAMGSGSRETA